MTKMKIIHIITRLDRGGSSEDVLTTCRHFGAPKYLSVVVCGKTVDASEPMIGLAEKAGTSFYTVSALHRSINPFNDLRALIGILAILKRERPDIVHTHTSKAGIIGRWAAWLYRLASRRRVSIVHATHGHVFYGYYPQVISQCFMMIERITALITDRIVVLTHNEIDEHLQRHIGRPEQFTVIHSGINYTTTVPDDQQQKLYFPQNALVVGSVGRLDPVKGFDIFIDAARTLYRKYPNMYFVLVGDGSQRAELIQRIKSYRIDKRCIITGWKDNPASYIEIMDIYVQPSLNEGLGKTILTAQLLKKPIVATAVQGIKSLIDHAVSGLLVPPGDPVALADAIEQLAADPYARYTLGNNAFHHVTVKNPDSGNYLFSEEEMIYLNEKLYTSL
jgi:glycosyltransferase involved in cell wall biosynthesis